jgi:hypothetical protein
MATATKPAWVTRGAPLRSLLEEGVLEGVADELGP